jgi:hypothetical protein
VRTSVESIDRSGSRLCELLPVIDSQPISRSRAMSLDVPHPI